MRFQLITFGYLWIFVFFCTQGAPNEYSYEHVPVVFGASYHVGNPFIQQLENHLIIMPPWWYPRRRTPRYEITLSPSGLVEFSGKRRAWIVTNTHFEGIPMVKTIGKRNYKDGVSVQPGAWIVVVGNKNKAKLDDEVILNLIHQLNTVGTLPERVGDARYHLCIVPVVHANYYVITKSMIPAPYIEGDDNSSIETDVLKDYDEKMEKLQREMEQLNFQD